MEGRGYYIVTGATGAIGQAICRRLVAEGLSVIATCRDMVRGERLASDLRQLAAKDAGVRIEALQLDDSRSIDDFAQRIVGTASIAALINNAGTMCRHYGTSNDGFEQTMAVNYFGTVLLTQLLLPAIADGGCIVFTTSVTRRLHRLTANLLHPTESDFSQLGIYGRSKLALTHYAMHLADTLRGRLRVNCADPGIVNSGMITMHRWFDPLANLLFRPLISSPDRGAESALQAAASPLTGMIFHHSRCHPIEKELSHDEAHRQLITATDNVVKNIILIPNNS